MGLFDFLKKTHTGSSAAVNAGDKPQSEGRTGVFKGDLAHISDTDEERKPESVHTVPGSSSTATDQKDSPDSVVFMSFAPTPKGRWLCPECGTSNEEELSGCIVCGREH